MTLLILLLIIFKINILVNNFSIIRRNPAIDFTEEDWDDVIDINLKNMFFLLQAVPSLTLATDF